MILHDLRHALPPSFAAQAIPSKVQLPDILGCRVPHRLIWGR